MKNPTREHLLERIRFLESRVRDLESIIANNNDPSESVKAEKIYEIIFRLSPAAIGITRLEDGVIYDVSDSYCEVTGYTREELLGNTTVNLKFWLDPRDRESVRDLLKRYGFYRNIELNFRKKNGSIYTVIQSAELVMLGEKHYVIGTHLDITDFKKKSRELIYKNEELDILNEKLKLINEELRKSKEAMRQKYEKGQPGEK